MFPRKSDNIASKSNRGRGFLDITSIREEKTVLRLTQRRTGGHSGQANSDEVHQLFPNQRWDGHANSGSTGEMEQGWHEGQVRQTR
jgi:hypothetical protein